MCPQNSFVFHIKYEILFQNVKHMLEVNICKFSFDNYFNELVTRDVGNIKVYDKFICNKSVLLK